MNTNVYRLIFDAGRGMCIPAAEGVRARGRAPRTRLRRLAALLAALGVAPTAFAVSSMPSSAALAQARVATGAPMAPLPVKAANFNGSGSATVTLPNAQSMVINQADQRIILNWESFDIAKGYSVQFVQPDGGSALNRIHSANPSLIMGSLRANGEVLLYNANGVVFGPNARVDAGNFIATTLNVSDNLFGRGFRSVIDGSPSFGGDDANPSGFIRVERGAEIRAAAGGQVLMFAPRVLNEGRIEAPGGQVGLAAGQKVYLSSSLNSAERGLLIEVDPFENNGIAGINTVENAQSASYWVYKTYLTGDGQSITQGQLPVGFTEAQLARLSSEKRLEYWVDADGRVQSEAALAALTPTARDKLTADGKLFKRTLTEKSETVSDAEVAALSDAQRRQYVAEQRLVQRINEIVTERGSTSMVALAVRQMGTIRATTAVKGQNGGIYLMAHGKTTAVSNTATAASNDFIRVAERMGDLVIGEDSLTQVTPVALNSETQLDAETFNPSIVRAEGKTIRVGERAVVRSTGGLIELKASEAPRSSPLFSGSDIGTRDASRIVIERDALLDASGLDNLRMGGNRNQMSGRLFSINLADAPLQRDRVLYRQNIVFDAREGVEVADVSDFYNLIPRSAAERSTAGGTIRLHADGDVIVAPAAKLDVSGGSIAYDAGTIATTLVRSGSKVYRITDAPKNLVYDEVLEIQDVRRAEAYVEGKDAGEVSLVGRRVVLQGELDGQVSAGVLQRGDYVSPDTGAPAWEAHRIRPRAGRLSLGLNDTAGGIDHYLGSILLSGQEGAVLPESFWLNPLSSELPDFSASSVLSTGTLNASGMGALALRANGRLTLDASASLELGPYGQFVARAAQVDIAGSVRAAGGEIQIEALTTSGAGGLANTVTLREGASLDVSGAWVNDRLTGTSLTAPVAIDGGTVHIAAYDGVDLHRGSLIDVSAGARRSASRALVYGDAGSIAVRHTIANADLALRTWSLNLAGELNGYGFEGGGALSFSAPELMIAAAAPVSGFWLHPDFFNRGGFQSYAIAAIGDVTLADNTQVRPVLMNRQLDPSSIAGRQSGRISADMYRTVLLTAPDREAVDVTLLATRTPNSTFGTVGSSLHIGKGASIETEAGGAITLAAGRSLTVEGKLAAPGGSLSLNIGGTYLDDQGLTLADIPAARGGPNAQEGDPAGLLSDQAIYLTGTAELLAQGALDTYLDPSTGRVSGRLLDGGTVNINARRGYVVASKDAVIDVSGAQGNIHLYSNITGSQSVYADAGSISVQSPEGIYMDATLKAGVSDPHATRGTLSMKVSRNGSDNYAFGNAYSTAERRIELTDALYVASDAAAPGGNIAGSLANGALRVSASRLNQAAFDTIVLSADDRALIESSLSLNAVRSLQLYASNIEAVGNAQAVFSAAHVAIGDSGIRPVAAGGIQTVVPPAARAAAVGQNSSLTLEAAVIDVIGRVGLSGLRTTTLDASHGGRTDGEIRLQGRLLTNASTDNQLVGGLYFADNLMLHAGQVYPTTLSRFDLQGLAGTSNLQLSSPVVGAGGRAPTTPLSAFASLNVIADKVSFVGRDAASKGGVLRVPFGSAVIKARESIVVGDGAELSASGAGVVVPVGTTVNGRSWFYSPGGVGGSTASVSLDNPQIAKELRLDAPSLTLSDAATLSVAGGGDLQAWEFLAGAKGSSDTLLRDGLYAIVKGYQFDFAPVDAEIAAEGGLPAIGSRIVIPAGVPGLEAGEYTLLPARYALLPGGYVVSATKPASLNGLPSVAAPDGSVEVSAAVKLAGTGVTEDAHRRYVIEPAKTFLAKSGYELTSGSDFYEQRAESRDTAVPRLPVDAGRLSLVSSQAFDLRAALKLGAVRDASGRAIGRAGEFDLSMANMAVVNGWEAAPSGYKAVSARSLSESGAESILLGGVRSGAGSALTITTTAANVQVLANDAPLRAEELILVATDSVKVGDGVTIEALPSGRSRADTLTLSGDGAFLRVSGTQGSSLSRTGALLSRGDLALGSDVVLRGAEVQLDATGRYSLATDDVRAGRSAPKFDAQSISLGARRIAVGGVSPEGDHLQLDGSLLNSLRSVSALALRSYTSIDLVAGIELSGTGPNGFSRLVLDTPSLRGLSAGETVEISASDVLLTNTSGRSAAAAGGSRLEISATPTLREGRTGGLVIGPGMQSIGFAETVLTSAGDIVFDGATTLSAAGDLAFEAARVTATDGARAAVSAAGQVEVAAAEGGRSLGETTGRGASLTLSARDIRQAGRVELASGNIALRASGSGDAIRFEEGSVTSARGFETRTVDGHRYYADAGSVSAEAAAGNVHVNGTIDVSALALGGDGGQITLAAANGRVGFGERGRLVGSAGDDARGGRLAVDAASLNNNGSLNELAALIAAQRSDGTGGFTQEIDVRVRTGNLSLMQATMKAENVTLAVDQGALTLGAGARIDADAEQGGVVGLFARDNLKVIDGAQISARSLRADSHGGDVTLATTSGQITLGAGSRIDASGDDALDGRIVLRAARSGNGVNVDRIAADWHAGSLSIEAVKVYSGTSVATGTSSGNRIGQATIAADTSTFMNSQSALLASLGLSGNPHAHLRAGVEIRSSGDLTLSNDWNLWSASRAGGESGYLTLRAAGNLLISNTLSDGFDGVARTAALTNGDSWSYRLVGGADLDAANVMHTVKSATVGDIVVAGNKMVRTGTGSIEMSAGRDIVLNTASNTPAVVYVAGARVSTPEPFIAPSGAVFSDRGGRLSLDAGRDISSAPSAQLINSWLYRTGRQNSGSDTFNESSYLAWWSRFEAYKQGVGSFGGGNVSVTAGGSIRDLSVVAPTSAYMASAAPNPNALTVLGGGDVDVRAGGSIQGGVFMLGRGEGRVFAGEDIRAGSAVTAQIGTLSPLFGLMDGQWDIAARGALSLGGVFNPTLFSAAQPIANTVAAVYSTYSPDAALRVQSASGDIAWSAPSSTILARLAAAPAVTGERLTYASSDANAFNHAPASVQVVAHAGDVQLAPSTALTLAPAANGMLEVYAQGDLSLTRSVRMLDFDPSALPSLTKPIAFATRSSAMDLLANTNLATIGLFSALHASDGVPNRLQAGGNLTASSEVGASFWSPKQAVVTAGGNITNFDYFGQHHRDTDVTVISAGGAIINDRTTNSSTLGRLSLAGPGLLELSAGRQIDLGKSAGVQTVGNLYNAALSSQGASVTMLAGTKASVDLDGFADTYLDSAVDADAPAYRQLLVAFVQRALGLPVENGPVSEGDVNLALERFSQLSRETQLGFARGIVLNEFAQAYVEQGKPYEAEWRAEAARFGVAPELYSGPVFERFVRNAMYAEVQDKGRQGSVATTRAERQSAYDQAYKAIDLAGLGKGFVFARADIDLVESKVHTQRGGDISFLAPGGNVNVGLGANAATTAVGQVQKPESDRGIVAFNGGSIRSISDGDFQVNTQKVFVIGQGDILLWSSNGNIDSGRGSNNTVTVPAAVPRVDRDGNVVFEIPPLATGSGIGILQQQDGRAEGTVYLYAPRGEIIALDASIRGPEINLGAEVVRGADNILGGSVTGTSSAPVSVAVSPIGSVSNPGESRTATGQVADEAGKKGDGGRERNSILTVELVGLGDSATGSGCREGDKDCAN